MLRVATDPNALEADNAKRAFFSQVQRDQLDLRDFELIRRTADETGTGKTKADRRRIDSLIQEILLLKMRVDDAEMLDKIQKHEIRELKRLLAETRKPQRWTPRSRNWRLKTHGSNPRTRS